MTLPEAAAFATHPDVQGPLTVAIETAAVAIANEDPETTNHTNRVNLATQVLQNPTYMVERFAWAVATNATVVGEWTAGDQAQAFNDFGFVIATIWDALAGPPAP